MIRDPSDGTVREVDHQPKPLETKPYASERPVLITTTSGLPDASTKPDRIARLEKSREWLKQYRKAAGDVNRMNDKGEIPNDATG